MTTTPTSNTTSSGAFGPRYARALSDAATWHHGQFRKGSEIPYVSHVLAVSAFLLEDGADEDEAIAGLLHDSIEDASLTVAELAARYGQRVADIVAACTDDWSGDPLHKSAWWPRKVSHIAHVTGAGADADLGITKVTAADKLANLRSTLDAGDPEVFSRFKAGIGGFVWYQETFGRLLAQRLGSRSLLAKRLVSALQELDDLVSAERRRLGGAVVEFGDRLAALPVPRDSGPYSPWPWFALDAVHRSGGTTPERKLVATCWQSWFGSAIPEGVLLGIE